MMRTSALILSLAGLASAFVPAMTRGFRAAKPLAAIALPPLPYDYDALEPHLGKQVTVLPCCPLFALRGYDCDTEFGFFANLDSRDPPRQAPCQVRERGQPDDRRHRDGERRLRDHRHEGAQGRQPGVYAKGLPGAALMCFG